MDVDREWEFGDVLVFHGTSSVDENMKAMFITNAGDYGFISQNLYPSPNGEYEFIGVPRSKQYWTLFSKAEE